MRDLRICKNCKHWRPWPKEKQVKLDDIGDCDKIKKGSEQICSFATEPVLFRFKGYSYWWESLDYVFHCYEEKHNGDIIV